MTLLNGLLKKNFSCTPADMKVLQLSDLKLRAIYEQVQDESQTNSKFVIINQILFKKTKLNSHIFCSPKILCKEIVFQCHNKSGFHFKIPQLTSLLKPLIFNPDLDELIKHTVQTCLICTISQPKRIRNLVGARRTNFYIPSQCLVIDSAYLATSSHGYSKALIIVDACTGYTIVYPSTSLQATAVKKHLQMYICSHPIPAEIKCDMGSEFRKGLDTFLAKYSITLSASKAYSKGSSSNAESAIRLVKSALRQLCLTHTSSWPEMLPLLVQGINASGLYGTSTSRSNLYFSPYSYSNHLQLDGILVPEAIFNQHFEQMKFIVKRRQSKLFKAQVLDKTKYQKGNLVLAVNHPVSNKETKGLSQELALTVRGVYYIKSVTPSHLRLIGLFTGEERTLPREYCVKLSLSNISQLQVKLESLQMQKVSNNLFKANRYLPPNSAKTWNFLLGKNSGPLDHNTSDFTPENDDPLDQDVESGPNPSFHEDTDPQIRNRKTRSGKAYLTVPTTPHSDPRSILKPARLATSFAKDYHPLTPSVILEAFPPPKPVRDSDHSVPPDFPGHSDTLVIPAVPGHGTLPPKVTDKSISFDNDLSIRFIAGKTNYDYKQRLLIQTEQLCILPRKTSLMLLSFGLDMSQSELCYQSTWSEPNPGNDILDLE